VALPSKRRSALLAMAAVIASLVPVAGASAATLTIKAPREIDHAEKFRVVAKGTARAHKDYFVSVIYHNDDQGPCDPTVNEEISNNTFYSVFYQYPVTTDGDGAYKATSRKIFGGIEVSGRFCGYLNNPAGQNKATAVRRIEFT
jgi:hypothetical protein